MSNLENLAKHVYVIEDDKAIRDSMVTMLESLGFLVHVYANPKDFFVDTIECPAVLISDTRLPEITGFELLILLRKNEINVPTILMSGHFSEAQITQAEEMGVLALLTKPFEVEKLLTAIDQGIKRQH